MIHFTCDSCARRIDTEREVRYVLKLEVYAATDQLDEATAEDDDHLEEVQRLVQQAIDSEDPAFDVDAVYQQLRFDLCEQCRSKILENPLGLRRPNYLGFSEN